MADHRTYAMGAGRQLSPEEISGHVFPNARKGLDPEAVRTFLGEVADQVRALRAERSQLQRAVQPPAPPPSAPPAIDEATLTRVLGEETTRVLRTARESAQEIVAKAEEQAKELTARADEHFAMRRDEAEALLQETRERGEQEVASLVERTKAECIAMIEEAREARRRVLADLVERRRTLLVQLEQIRLGKESMVSLIESVAATVTSSIESVRGQLAGAEEVAQAAAAERAAAELDSSITGGEDVDALVAQALAKLPSAGDSPVFTSFHGRSDQGGPQVFDIERERQIAERAKAATLPESPRDALASEPGPDEAPVRLPDRTPTVGQAPTAPAERDADGGSPLSEPSPVDELFAKIRASRETSVAAAQEVLGHGTPEDPSAARSRRSARPKAPADTDADSQGSEERSSAPRAEAEAGAEAGAGAEDPHRARRDALVEPAQHELARALKRVLREEQNLLLDQIRNRKRSDPVGLLRFDADARGRLAESVMPGLALAQGAGAKFLEEASSSAVPSATESLDVRPIADRLVSEIADSVDLRLADSARDGIDAADLAEMVGTAFREWKAGRLEALAGDFATEAFGAGALAFGSAAKLKLSWRFDDGGRDCPDCDDNAMAGPVAAGEEFPTGHRHPPVHPGCRCFLFA